MTAAPDTPDPQHRSQTTASRLLIAHAFELARVARIETILVRSDDPGDVRQVNEHRRGERVIWMTSSASELSRSSNPDEVLEIPDAPLARMSQIRIGMFLAVLDGRVRMDEELLCLSGLSGADRLDTLVITDPQRDFPWFRDCEFEKTRAIAATKEFARLLEFALRLAAEGREGRAVGTIFVLGDVDASSNHIRQLILNPCAGHPPDMRSIHRHGFFETIREFAAIDGAFIVNREGIVESAGTYLDVPTRESELQAGLGARHAAAAGVSRMSDAIAIVVSESSGTVHVFDQGRSVLELQKA